MVPSFCIPFDIQIKARIVISSGDEAVSVPVQAAAGRFQGSLYVGQELMVALHEVVNVFFAAEAPVHDRIQFSGFKKIDVLHKVFERLDI